MTEGGTAMELGCEIGYMTSLIAPNVKILDVIEGSPSFIAEASKRNIKNAVFFNKLFEEVTDENRYDYIFASHVVEHLENPNATLEKMYQALKPGGYIFVTVPNALAASRQLALKMDLLQDHYALTENDIRGGHRRVYNPETIGDEVRKAGFDVVELSGLLFKPFADFQMDELLNTGFLTSDHMNGLMDLGKDYPELCGAIFVCGKK